MTYNTNPNPLCEALGCDPSWESHIVAVMERDHPGLLHQALNTAVEENAMVRVQADREGWSEDYRARRMACLRGEHNPGVPDRFGTWCMDCGQQLDTMGVCDICGKRHVGGTESHDRAAGMAICDICGMGHEGGTAGHKDVRPYATDHQDLFEQMAADMRRVAR